MTYLGKNTKPSVTALQVLTSYSAVDTHVAQQLLDKALTGELGLNRTRILVTHHVGLCVSKATYIVVLERGRIVCLGSPKNLRSEAFWSMLFNIKQQLPVR